MSEETALVLTVETIGTTEHPRHLIVNGSMYWTGETWTDNKDAALKYHDFNEASGDVHKLLMVGFQDKPVRRFYAPIFIELFTDQEVSLDEIRKWLHRSATLTVAADENGTGPVKGALGLCHIEWASLREMTAKK